MPVDDLTIRTVGVNAVRDEHIGDVFVITTRASHVDMAEQRVHEVAVFEWRSGVALRQPEHVACQVFTAAAQPGVERRRTQAHDVGEQSLSHGPGILRSAGRSRTRCRAAGAGRT